MNLEDVASYYYLKKIGLLCIFHSGDKTIQTIEVLSTAYLFIEMKDSVKNV